MPKETTEIEVEVVAIDGLAPPATPAPTPESTHPPRHDWQDWRQWQGSVRRLDSRWWPLWIILGILALGLFLTFGLVLAVIFGIVRLILRLIRAVFR
jgi:hypothetical protein